MSNLDMRHPDQDQLMLYLDGELSGRKAKRIREHLEACWQCRTELQALEATIADCVRYRNEVLAVNLPAAPAQWKPLDFEKAEEELASRPLTAVLAGWLSLRQSSPLRWALTGAAVLALAFVAIQKLNQAPKVEAAALLKKAVEVTEARPHTAKRLRIVTSSRREITRVIYGASKPEAGEREIAAMFLSAHYDWRDPLSARAYSDWYGQLTHKQDQLDTTDKDSYIIKTTTDEGELLSATLKMRATDFEAVQGRFEFRNHEWVEMTELVYQQALPASTVAGTTGGAPRQPGAPPVSSHSVTTEPAQSSGYAEELQVFAALRQVNADLGDPIEVSRQGAGIIVSGTGVPHQHQQQLHALLDRMPHVTVRFSEPSLPASTPPAPEPVTRDAAGPEKPKYPARLEARLGGRPQFERFSGQVLDWTESVMSRVYALHRLAQQFPAEAEAKMSAEERRTLHSLALEHASALATDLRKVTNTVNPVLTGIGGRTGATAPSVAAVWQPATEQLFTTGRKTETLLAGVLGVTASTAGDDAASQLLTALAQFSTDTQHYLSLLQ
jgi:hypothetical protein